MGECRSGAGPRVFWPPPVEDGSGHPAPRGTSLSEARPAARRGCRGPALERQGGKRGAPGHPLPWRVEGTPGRQDRRPGWARPLPARPPARPPGRVLCPGRSERGRCPAPRRPPPPPHPRAGPGPRSPRRPPLCTFNHVAVDGGAELLARALVEVLPVDDPHLLQEGGLAALARAQQQDLHEPLHVGLLPGQAFVDLLGLALLLGLAAREHAAGEAHGQHGPRRQEVRHLAAAAAASAGPSGSLHLLLGRRAAPATRLEGGERCGGPSAPGEGGNQRGPAKEKILELMLI
uniref:Uncharacterized protein n=1 Tax=Felis catus TaxID=9685 RepID=A0ABI7WZ33_FELCA